MLFFTVFTAADLAQEVIPKPSWSSNMTNFLLHYLQKNNEGFITRVDPKTNKPYTFALSYEYLNPIVLAALREAKKNPSWGPPNLVALKYLVVIFGESSFDETCVRLNRNFSLDMGLMQINSCNWFYPDKKCAWSVFCKKNHLNSCDMGLFFDPEINIRFGAVLNEYFIHVHQAVFSYYDNPRRCRLYKVLIQYCGYKKLAQQYNDGQYGNVELAEK